MTRSSRIGLAAALLLSGITFAMAQNGPPTGGYPPARWNPNFYGHYGYSHYPRYYGYYRVYPTVPGYWDYYQTSAPGRGNDEEFNSLSAALCFRCARLGTSQDFLFLVTFWASGDGALARPENPQGASNATAVSRMTVRFIPILAATIMIGPSLAYGSPTCMTESEVLAKFPKATHLYMRQKCWSDSAVAPVHPPRPPPRAAVPAPSARRALAVAPESVNSGTDAGAQCQYSPCE